MPSTCPRPARLRRASTEDARLAYGDKRPLQSVSARTAPGGLKSLEVRVTSPPPSLLDEDASASRERGEAEEISAACREDGVPLLGCRCGEGISGDGVMLGTGFGAG